MSNFKKYWWVWYWIIALIVSIILNFISNSDQDFGILFPTALFMTIFSLPLFLIIGLILSIKKIKSKQLILSKQKSFWVWLILTIISISFTLFVFIAGP